MIYIGLELTSFNIKQTQPAFTFSKLPMKAPEQCVKSVQSQQ